MLLSGPSWLQLKNGQLGPDNNTSNLRAQIFSKKCWNPYCYSVFWQTMFCKKANLAQIITPQKAKLGPDNNTTAFICIHIHIHYYRASSKALVAWVNAGIDCCACIGLSWRQNQTWIWCLWGKHRWHQNTESTPWACTKFHHHYPQCTQISSQTCPKVSPKLPRKGPRLPPPTPRTSTKPLRNLYKTSTKPLFCLKPLFL